MSGNEAEGGGVEENIPRSGIYRSAVSCDRAWIALNHRRTVNHSLEGTSQATRRRAASFTVSLFQGPWKQSTRSLLWPVPALGTECNANQSKREALCWVLEDR